MSTTNVILTAMLLSSALACGSSKSVQSNYQTTTTYFTHGSPLAVIEGATADTSGLFAPSLASDYQDFHLMNTASFVTKTPQSDATSFSQVENQNRTDGSSSSGQAVPIYEFKDGDAGKLIWAAVNDVPSPVFEFDATGPQLKLLTINGQAADVVHYSVKNDHKAFSILVKYSQVNSGLALTAYTFGDTKTLNSPVYTDGDYQYLQGSEKIVWDTLPEVSYCGAATSSAVLATVQQSVEAWGADPDRGDSPLPIAYRAASVYPPFSDLNAHCIYVVSSFDDSDSAVAKTLGVTLPKINLATHRIVDSDVFLFADFIPDELAAAAPSRTVMHEMGHFWGLGHDFRAKADGTALHPTIMGYSQGTDTITSWDFAAIRDLYTSGFDVTP